VDAAPLDRQILAVPLPAGTPPLYGVTGRDDHDVWLLGRRGDETPALLHWDGARFESVPGPRCPRKPAYESVVALPDTVVLVGVALDEGGELTMVSRRGDRDWSCETVGDVQIVALGKARLRYRRDELTLDDERQPLLDPHHAVGARHEVAASAPDDLWLYVPGGGIVLHGNGVAWESRPPGVARVHSLRVDSGGAAWLVGSDEKADEGHVVQRWDREARAWQRLPAPRDLRGSRVRPAGDRDVWILGKEHLHRWDGQVFHRGPTPLGTLRAAWTSPSGELWMVGSAPGSDAGAAFRAVEKKP
jgi:hypothetical protein